MRLEMMPQQAHAQPRPTSSIEQRASLALLAIIALVSWRADGSTHTKVDGAAFYAARCAGCHQPTGTGLPGVFPPLAGSEWVNGNEAVLIQVVLHGVQGALTVRGEQYDMSMPAMGAQMSDAEIAAVASYVRSQWGNKAAAVASETVTRQRAASAARSSPWSEAELTKLQR